MNTNQASARILDLIRRCFAAYKSADRNEIEALLAKDFTFTSPYDDHIDRQTYFERCWPQAGTFEYQKLEEIFVQGDEGFVLYDGAGKNGNRFRNTELFKIHGDRIRSVEVFFGRPSDSKLSAADDSIRAIVESQAQAIRAKDVQAIMAHYAPDVVSFDVVAPLRNRGSAATRQRLEHWFAAYNGAIGCEMRDVEVHAAGDIAFCYFLEHFTGTMTSGTAVDMWVRVTMGLRNIDGRWLIVHQHMSDPFDGNSGKALTNLKP